MLARQGFSPCFSAQSRITVNCRGWVGFDDCVQMHVDHQPDRNHCHSSPSCCPLFLLKRRAQDNAMELAEDLCTVLDHQDSWIYVVDAKTKELLTSMGKTHRLAGFQGGDAVP